MIPEKFLLRMKELLGEDFDAFANALERPSVRAVRVNTTKTTVDTVLGECELGLTPIPYTEVGFILRDAEGIGNGAAHHAGMYYVQDPGAMATVSALEVKEGWWVLDTCAAPGGKSSQLASLIGESGFILSNDSRMGEVTEMMRLTTEWAKEQLHAKKIIYKPTPYIYHLQPSQEDLYALFAIGARLTGRSLSSTINNKERIAFGQLRRRKAQKAAKEGITYKEDNDYVTYWEILTGLLTEAHDCRPTHTVEEIELLHSRFPDKIKLYTAYKAEKMLAGCVVYETKKTAHIQYIASSPEGKEKGALDGLFEYLFENIYNKIEYIDFGISTERRGAYLNEGLLFQKEGFGGRAVTYDIYEISLTD